jgi:hypothetical protein
MEKKMAENAEDVAAKLEAAVKADQSDSSTGEKEVVSQQTKNDDGMIPRSRYNEVSEKLSEATKTWEAEKAEAGKALTEAQAKVTELAEAMAKSQDDIALVAALKQLARDPKHSDLIARVDLALDGKPYESVDQSDDDDDDSDSDSTPAVDKKSIMAEIRSEMDEALEENKHNLIIQQADLLAKDYMRQLPADKYSDDQKNLIANLWANKVDWDAIANEPDKLGNFLSETLQSTLNEWDAAHPAPEASEENNEDKQQESSEPTTEEQIAKILGKDWGQTKIVGDGDAQKLVSETSDEEFTAAFGKLFKNLNALNG